MAVGSKICITSPLAMTIGKLTREKHPDSAVTIVYDDRRAEHLWDVEFEPPGQPTVAYVINDETGHYRRSTPQWCIAVRWPQPGGGLALYGPYESEDAAKDDWPNVEPDFYPDLDQDELPGNVVFDFVQAIPPYNPTL